MRSLVRAAGAFVLLMGAPAYGQAVCFGATPAFGAADALADGMCAPVSGSIAVENYEDGNNCADGSFDLVGKRKEWDAAKKKLVPKPHRGVDLLASAESEVYAAAKGDIWRRVEDNESIGNELHVRHSDGSTSRYGHLSSMLFTADDVGKEIVAGEKLGQSGMTGNAKGTTCPHLHFRVDKSKADGPTDPLAWLKAGLPQLMGSTPSQAGDAAAPGLAGKAPRK